MRVVLLHVKENFTPVPPMGILYIGTLLKQKGHQVMVFDVIPSSKESIIEKIKSFNPHLIGFSAMTTSYKVTKEFNNELRAALPNAYFCWGGVHATAMPEYTIKENHLDFIAYGEAELTMVEVCSKIKSHKQDPFKQGINLKGVLGVYYFEKGSIIKNPPRPYIEDLDSLPIPDRSLLENFKWYLSPPGILRRKFYYGITTMYTSRGCPYNCIFCCSKLVLGRRIRQRSVENVLKEMRYLKEEFGVVGIYFNDDTFATNKEWVLKFCRELKKSKLNMIWGCQTRANYAQDPEIINAIADAGCVQVDIGIESGSDNVLETLKKGITTSQIRKALTNLRKVKMDTFATFIIGNPGETMSDIRKTERIARLVPGGVSFLLLVPYPGSPLFEMAASEKWFTDNIDHLTFDERWTNKQSDVPVMEASFKAKELVKIRAELENKFFIKNYSMLIVDFLKNPYFLYKMVLTFIRHPIYMFKASLKAVRNKKIMGLMEDVYQKFSEELG